MRTDLALLLSQGSEVVEREGYRVVRSPLQPTYHWGNFLSLNRAPGLGELAGWLAVMAAEFPTARHVAIGVDGATLPPGVADEAGALGLAVEYDAVLVADRLDPAPSVDATLGILDVDDDDAWAASLELTLRHEDDTAEQRAFAADRAEGLRQLQRDGRGAWWGARTSAGELVATLGVYDAGLNDAEGRRLGRYQNVLTDAGHRRRGLAGALVRVAGAWALDELGCDRLVIVADPDGPAIGTYRRAGLTDLQTQVAFYRPPPPPTET